MQLLLGLGSILIIYVDIFVFLFYVIGECQRFCAEYEPSKACILARICYIISTITTTNSMQITVRYLCQKNYHVIFCGVQNYNQIKEKLQIKFHQVKIKHSKEILQWFSFSEGRHLQSRKSTPQVEVKFVDGNHVFLLSCVE